MRAFAIVFLLLSPLLGAAPAPSQGLPAVDLSVTPETDGMEPKADLIVYAFITNKSEAELSQVSLDTLNDRFKVVATTGLSSSLGPLAFTDPKIQLRIRSGETVPFGKYQVPFTLRYHWSSPQPKIGIASAAAPANPLVAGVLEGDSEQRAVVTVEIKAPYSAVASGLPGGTGPLFWLLLPVIPAFLAFQFVQGLRAKQGPKVPTFSADTILPAFLIAIAANSLSFWSTSLAGLSTMWLLVGSGLLGALWPSGLWIWDEVKWRHWGFREDDKVETYFRKVLLSWWVPRPLVWVTGTAGKATVRAGLLLAQPDRSQALGSQLTVSPVIKESKEQERIETLVTNANKGARRDRKKLVQELKKNKVTVSGLQKPELGNEPGTDLAVTGPALQAFEVESAERKPLLTYSQ
jgi:hypothetical protein